MSYRLNPDMKILPLDTSSSNPMYQVVVQGRRFHVTRETLRVIELVREGGSPDEVTERLKSEYEPSGRLRSLNRVLNEFRSNKILVDADYVPEDAPATGRRTRTLLIDVPLFEARQLRQITGTLSGFFESSRALIAVATVVTVHALVLSSWKWGARGHAPLSGMDWCLLIGIVFCGLMVHELGHASACTRFGVTHGRIGFGFYLIYPVLYADVDAAWSLNRFQRAAVDAGGLYFHLMYSTVLAVVWLFTHDHVLRLAIHSVFLSVVLNLNPFLKFDGYWALSDLLGIPNLRAVTQDLWFCALRRLMGKPAVPMAQVFAPSHRLWWGLVVYATASIVFTAFFLHLLFAVFLPAAVEAYPTLLMTLLNEIGKGEWGRTLVGPAARLAFLTAGLYVLGRMLHGALRTAWRKARGADWLLQLQHRAPGFSARTSSDERSRTQDAQPSGGRNGD